MFSRKQLQVATTPQIPPQIPGKVRDSKTKDTHLKNPIISPHLKCTIFLVSTLFTWLLVLTWFRFSPSNYKQSAPTFSELTCQLSVYMYELPAEFNLGLLTNCTQLNVYTNMCPHVANRGLGQPLHRMGPTSWFATHQFIAEMIFHARVENHPCRTRDPAAADIFYVPFYGGLHASSKFREANHTARDELAVQLVGHLESQPWWARHHGRDHFMALGRTAWDFMRDPRWPDFGANILLNLPAVNNMSVLTVERQPWQGSNQHGIPYPSYFHPHTFQEILTWQKRIKSCQRPYLFSFIGAPRKGVEKAEIRNELIRQCGRSSRCKLIKCGKGASKCHDPVEVLRVMSSSRFCLQAPGDSFTRRSTFDSILAGCIPVFFSPHTAYTQYSWYFPSDGNEYSVYIDERKVFMKGNKSGATNIEEKLMKIGKERVEEMQERVLGLIPSVTYAHPDRSDVGFQDAVDVALLELVQHVRSLLN